MPGRFAGEQMGFNILNPFTYGNLGKAIDKTRSGDQNVEYENTPTGPVSYTHLRAHETDRKFLKQICFRNLR